ncbi:MAG: amidase [Chloroflexota bacterium]|nr:MAG: amidase [Chloroflexota bacterium]
MNEFAAQPILTLVNALRSGELSLHDYLDELQVRFAEMEPKIHAFVPEDDRFDRLRYEAQALVEQYPKPLSRPPLFGLPFGIKDIFRVDGFDTHAGSDLPPKTFAGREARAVTILKSAGALILGKAVTTEFAYFGPGPSRNPHNPDHTPGGSSSGSAAAVAAGLCPIATGTQTIGSIVRPASFCGIVGFKPSYERISRSGVIPLAPSLDHIGVFASHVAGVELAASILCPDWQLAVAEMKPVLGVPEGEYLEKATADGLDHFEDICRALDERGYIVKKVPTMSGFDETVARHQLILAAEAAQVHAHWYAEYGHLYHEATVELIERGREISVGELAEALNGRQQLRRDLTSLMDEHGLDLWICPSAPGAAPRGLESTGDPTMNLPWTHSGLPSVNLPVGFDENGLPMGLQVAGRWYEDEALLEWSAQLEMSLVHRA